MQAYCSHAHTASVNGVAFAPHELGLMLATASSDGSISILTYQAGQGWSSHKVHPLQTVIVFLARELLSTCRFCCTVAHFSRALNALVSWDLTLGYPPFAPLDRDKHADLHLCCKGIAPACQKYGGADTKCPPAGGDSSFVGASSARRLPYSSQGARPG